MLKSYGTDTIAILIITKGYSSVKIGGELQFLFSAHHLMMLYICTKFLENILKGFRFMKGKGFVTDRQTTLG